MHLISKKRLKLFWEKNADSEAPLLRWHQVVRQKNYKSFAELRQTFPSADLVNGFVVFNIAGNKYRLIASVHFNRSKIYVRHVLSHAEYDKGEWKQ